MQHSRTIGVLSPLVGGFYFGGILAGIVQSAQAAGVRVIAIQTQDAGLAHWAHAAPPPFALPLADQHVAGWVVILNAGTPEHLQHIQDSGVPLVMVSHALDQLTCPVVFTENRSGIREAVTHLIHHGHRQIAFAGNLAQSDIHERFLAYQEALLTHGIQPNPHLVFSIENNHETGGCHAAEQLLAAGLPSTALVAGTDLNAIGIIKTLTSAGYCVPHDQAIVSFDDVALAAYSVPPLSSIRQRFHLLGQTATELVLAQLAGADVPPIHYAVPTVFVPRESCGCTPDAVFAPRITTGERRTQDWQEQLAQQLAALIGGVGDTTMPLAHALQPVIRPIVAMVAAVLGGHTAPSAPLVRQTWVAMYQLNPQYDTMVRILHELRQTGRRLIADAGSHQHERSLRLEDFLQHAMLELTRIHVQAQFNATLVLQSAVGHQSEITLKLLRSHEEDIRALAWLHWTPAHAGVFGMWVQPAGEPEGNRRLEVVGVFQSEGLSLQQLVGQQYRLDGFPPAELVALARAMPAPANALLVLPVKVNTSDWGMLAVVAPIETHSTGRETFNQCAALLTVALDHEAVLQSLREQRESLAQAYQRERELLQTIRVSEERYAWAARAANDGLWDWDLVTNTIYYSPRWKAMLGYADARIGTHPDEWFGRVHPDDQAILEQAIAAHRDGSVSTLACEHRMRNHTGDYRWILCRGLMVHDTPQRTTRLIGSLTDITDRKDLEARLQHAAWHDALTGLPNRSLFRDRLDRVIAHAKRDANYHCAVLFLDLDSFKIINDSLGHFVGDQLLIGMTLRLATYLRADDTAARFGGDEFAILLNGLHDQAHLPALVERIQAHLALPFQLQGHEVVVTASIGIAGNLATYTCAEDVLRDADIAMYRAKAAGKRTYAIFDPSMDTGMVNRLVIEAELRRAIEQQEFEVHYQPIVHLATGKVISVEALIRWRHPTQGLLAPSAFLPIAEEMGLTIDLGRWIFAEVCDQLCAWQTTHDANTAISVSVNLNHKQFWHPHLLADMTNALRMSGLDARVLNLEITEGVIMKNPAAAQQILHQLHQQGFHLHIDDFGTGYSSLEALHHFSIDALKIDRSFVARLGVDQRSTELVRTIIMMGRNLGMDVIAEGIETAEQQCELQALACRSGQGYHIGRPITGDAMPAWLERHRNARL